MMTKSRRSFEGKWASPRIRSCTVMSVPDMAKRTARERPSASNALRSLGERFRQRTVRSTTRPHLVLEDPDALDLALHLVPHLERPHARRRSREDDVSGEEGHHVRHELDQRARPEGEL